MRYLSLACLLLLSTTPALFAKVVVFWQDGFPVIGSQPVGRQVLNEALRGLGPEFADAADLNKPATLRDANLLVMPYGSAVPVEAWASILGYLNAGGNLLVLGGQPFRVPVRSENGKFIPARPQDTYSRAIGIRHTYEVPQTDFNRFEWKPGYEFLNTRKVSARKFFVLEGQVNGLGYMLDSDGDRVAAPVVVADHTSLGAPAEAMFGSRIVLLDFDPEPGYWESPDGISLLRSTAAYASEGATVFSLELQFSTVRKGEAPQVVVHLQNVRSQRRGLLQTGAVQLELLSGTTVRESREIAVSGGTVDAGAAFPANLSPGFYTVRGTYSDNGKPREFYQNGFWVEDEALLHSGPGLGVKGDFLTKNGNPYFPFGTNYFTTERNGWDFSGPRNAAVWERDFADMEKHGVTFVRTGVWMGNVRFVQPATGGVNERFLRNLEAYLLCARRHGIFVNFTFFAFDPQTIMRHPGQESAITGPGTNPYTDPVAIRAEQNYLLSIVSRFKDVPYLCWDLINEPSFSNPKRLWKGNTPNNDPTEIAAWQKWLKTRYANIARLADAWSVTPEQLGAFDRVPLPHVDDLSSTRYGDANEVRAVDYNLFAQAMFSRWVGQITAAIRSTGSRQLIDVGQDEGGVADRVLNQFYGGAGVSFTTNHTYWRDDALLWDSVVAKRPGIPNVVGETGYQPVWIPDGQWRYDEVTGAALLERKWALGFAAANSGALQWDWAREPDFGMKRSDGSSKIWEGMMRDMGAFAEKAAPYATGLIQPQVAIMLPQSLQLSTFNRFALEAQQKCVRALYHYARSEAYAAGEYQIELLGNPKLIIVPSPWTLSDDAWRALLEKAQSGATLLISGPFDDDPHFHPSGRQKSVGLDYRTELLTTRENLFEWPGGEALLTYSGEKTTYLEQAQLPEGSKLVEKSLGKGKLLFAPLPLELNDNLDAVGAVYHYALQVAGVSPVYSTTLKDPGILIAPTRFPKATLYVITSESNQRTVSFRDDPSGQQFSGTIDPGRAALLLVGNTGEIIAAYNWQ